MQASMSEHCKTNSQTVAVSPATRSKGTPGPMCRKSVPCQAPPLLAESHYGMQTSCYCIICWKRPFKKQPPSSAKTFSSSG